MSLINSPKLSLLSSARGIGDEVLWQSEPELIGKTYWIGVVYYSDVYKETLTGYHFICENYDLCRPISQFPCEYEHPAYNSNDTYCGLPKTLKKIWSKSEEMRTCAFLSKEEALSKIDLLKAQKSKQTLFD